MKFTEEFLEKWARYPYQKVVLGEDLDTLLNSFMSAVICHEIETGKRLTSSNDIAQFIIKYLEK